MSLSLECYRCCNRRLGVTRYAERQGRRTECVAGLHVWGWYVGLRLVWPL